MFIDFLSKTEQMIFSSLANEILRADGELDELEQKKNKEFSNILSSKLGVNFSKDYGLSRIEEIGTKRIFLIELIRLCFIDRDYGEKERVYIFELATKLNINQEVYMLEELVLNKRLKLVAAKYEVK
jgi:hypothetical protein